MDYIGIIFRHTRPNSDRTQFDIIVNKINSKLPSAKVEKVLACMQHAMIIILTYPLLLVLAFHH